MKKPHFTLLFVCLAILPALLSADTVVEEIIARVGTQKCGQDRQAYEQEREIRFFHEISTWEPGPSLPDGPLGTVRYSIVTPLRAPGPDELLVS